jgi:hypothetical protein
MNDGKKGKDVKQKFSQSKLALRASLVRSYSLIQILPVSRRILLENI